MSKKIKVDTNELERAIKLFNRVVYYQEQGGITERVAEGVELTCSLSDNWKGEAGSKFTSELLQAYTDMLKLKSACMSLASYCKSVKRNAEHSDDILYKLFHAIFGN